LKQASQQASRMVRATFSRFEALKIEELPAESFLLLLAEAF